MNSPKTVADMRPGDEAVFSRTVTECDLALFAAATGDANPIHFDQKYAQETFFKGRIAHGILSAGFVSAVLANRLPGLGTVYVSQNLRFLAPVRIGDTLTVRVEVLDVNPEKNRVRLRTGCINQDGTMVLDGEAVVMPPKRRLPPEDYSAIVQKTMSVNETLAAATSVFLAAMRGKQTALYGSQRTLTESVVQTWKDQSAKWLEMVDCCQLQTKEILKFMGEQSLAAQQGSRAFVTAWVTFVDKCNGEICNVWQRAQN